jgi:hypothetical protein
MTKSPFRSVYTLRLEVSIHSVEKTLKRKDPESAQEDDRDLL